MISMTWSTTRKYLFKVFPIGCYEMETILRLSRRHCKHFYPCPFLFLSDFKLLPLQGALSSLLIIYNLSWTLCCRTLLQDVSLPTWAFPPSESLSPLLISAPPAPVPANETDHELTDSLLLNGSLYGPRTAINPWYILPSTLNWRQGNCY